MLTSDDPMQIHHLPPPRGDRRLRDSLRARVENFDGSVVHWEAVLARRYATWMGASIPDLGWHERPWGLDITGPGESGGDPLALDVERDLVEVVVYDRSRPSVRGRLVTERPDGVTEILVPASAWPPQPWCVDIDLGWSTRQVSDALSRWFGDVGGRPDILVVSADEAERPSLRAVSGLVQAVDAAFDDLLALDPADAAVICSTLTAVADALAA